MTRKQELKEHKEHQRALKPLLKHLKSDEKKIGKTMKSHAKKPVKSSHEGMSHHDHLHEAMSHVKHAIKKAKHHAKSEMKEHHKGKSHKSKEY